MIDRPGGSLRKRSNLRAAQEYRTRRHTTLKLTIGTHLDANRPGEENTSGDLAELHTTERTASGLVCWFET
jgi:hypothetical protein